MRAGVSTFSGSSPGGPASVKVPIDSSPQKNETSKTETQWNGEL